MKLAKSVLALSAAGLFSVTALGAGKVPATEKDCTSAKSKKAGWVWENGACAKKGHKAAEKAAPAAEQAPAEEAAPAPKE